MRRPLPLLLLPFCTARAQDAPRLLPQERPVCEDMRGASASIQDPAKIRASAQAGLGYLARSTLSWQSQHNCYGCHVQAVALEALAVGVDHDYEVPRSWLDGVAMGIILAPGGTRSKGGLHFPGGPLAAASQGFGGQALARYDDLVDPRYQGELLGVATQILALQADDGSISDPELWANPPVGSGSPLQLETQALLTLRQAWERSAERRWLAAMTQLEVAFRRQVAALSGQEDLQTLNYAILGLRAAGAGASDPMLQRLAGIVMSRQNADGGWGLQPRISDAFATGQVLTALRAMGLDDLDPVLARGSGWLMAHQGPEGGWGKGSQAAAMWAVLGLVATDVVTLQVSGVADGKVLDGDLWITAQGHDNLGGGLASIELFVDEVPQGGSCGSRLETTWDTSVLAPGPHLVELRATNLAGRTVSHRAVVYAGGTWVVDPATRWDEGATVISARNLGLRGTVRVSVLRGDEVLHHETLSAQPSFAVRWGGPDQGRYTARFEAIDDGGQVLQTLDLPFVHADPRAQEAGWARIGGRVALPSGASASVTRVELLDATGQVIGSTTTTQEGIYEFDGLDAGEYRVRVVKESVGEDAQEVQAAPAKARTEADLQL